MNEESGSRLWGNSLRAFSVPQTTETGVFGTRKRWPPQNAESPGFPGLSHEPGCLAASQATHDCAGAGGVGDGVPGGARGRVQEPGADERRGAVAGVVDCRRVRGVLGVVSLGCDGDALLVGLACRQRASVADAADGEDNDRCQDAENDDDDEKLDEGESSLVSHQLADPLHHLVSLSSIPKTH